MLLEELENRIWFADTEVFLHDNIWVFTNVNDETYVFHNDNNAICNFINIKNPILVGYNFRDYDQYILKGCLADFSPEQLKDINDCIIRHDDDMYDELWGYFDGVWVDMPPIIDLFHDIVPRKSLKLLEGNLGLSVYESKIPFDIDRKLTSEEIKETISYCKYDVKATSVLYSKRKDYIQSKITLCEICGVDPLPMLKHSNARVLSEVFHAKEYDYDEEETYEIPSTIDITAIPSRVISFVSDCCVNTTLDENIERLTFDFHGVPTVFGIGGIHSADSVPYIEESTDDRIILIQDITSYYPSIILQYNYLSRAIDPSCAELYQHFYNLRVEAKKSGNKEDANAAKLVLNTFSGAMGNKYNKLYDPIMPLGLRLTGQLAIMDAVNCAMRNAETARFIQLNTDGWVISVDRNELNNVLNGVSEWEERTGFSVDTQIVQKIIQRDVNNYVMVKEDGSVKTKGSTVNLYSGGDFKANSISIVHKAIVDKLLNDKDISETITECTDPMAFQLVAKAGHTYDHCIHNDEELLLANRIFASNDENDGVVFKVKVDDEGIEHLAKIPNCPEHSFVYNGEIDESFPFDKLNKQWYIDYAQKRLKEFVKGAISFDGEEVVFVTETTEKAATPKRKQAVKKEEVVENKSFAELALEKQPTNIHEAMFKLQILMSGNSGSVKFDGYIDNISYSYADTQQYKNVLAKCASECGLYFSMSVMSPLEYKKADDYFDQWYFVQNKDDIDCALNGQKSNHDGVNKNRKKFVAAELDVKITFTFVLTGEKVEMVTSGMGVGTQGNCVSIAITNALRNFITNNFLMDNKGREGDDVAANFVEELSQKAATAYTSPEQKQEIKENIIAEKKQEARYATLTYAEALYNKIQEAIKVDESFANIAKTALENGYEDGKPKVNEHDENRSVLKQAGAGKLMRQAEEVIANAKA